MELKFILEKYVENLKEIYGDDLLKDVSMFLRNVKKDEVRLYGAAW